MGEVGSRGLTFFYELLGADGLLLAEGSTRHLFTDASTKPIRMPEKIRARFAEFVGARCLTLETPSSARR
jgi:acyl-CoA thioesterase FadM